MPAALALQTGTTNLPFVRLNHDCGDSAEVYLHGAHVTSWRSGQNGRQKSEQLYLSRDSLFAAGKAIRGGVPVIFPQFGAFGPGAKHGFARTMAWHLDTSASSLTRAEFTLDSSAATLIAWPFNFSARYQVEITPGALLVQLQIKNTSTQVFNFTSALHTYLASPDYRQGALRGLEGLEYWDNGTPWALRSHQIKDDLTITDNLDRVYFDAVKPLVWSDQARALNILAEGFRDLVVWNPGNAGAAALTDMPDDDFVHMLCVEAANVAEPTQLEPGATWVGSQHLSLLG